MNRDTFLETLHRSLRGMPQSEVDDIVADYAAHFTDGHDAGRSDAEIAEALGDPARLARELRAEAGVRRWEQNRTPWNFALAVFGLLALVTVNFVFLLPALVFVLFATCIAGIVALGLVIAGLAIVVNLDRTVFIGLAFLGYGVGGTALLLLMLNGLVSLLAKYVRLHYTVVNQAPAPT